MVALIPARAGSRRIPGKNTKVLAGHPLIAYTIAAAKESGVFSQIMVCTDDQDAIDITKGLGESWFRRKAVSDDQRDVEWVRDAIDTWLARPESFAILRPTSPFRTAETIRRAHRQFTRSEVHSIRAVELVTEHPGKMWELRPSGCIAPLLEYKHPDGTPWHSSPTQTLPTYFRQNASLEMAWSYVVTAYGTISGSKVAPFFTEGYEGLDLNTETDWDRAEAIAAAHPEALPRVDVAALSPLPTG